MITINPVTGRIDDLEVLCALSPEHRADAVVLWAELNASGAGFTEPFCDELRRLIHRAILASLTNYQDNVRSMLRKRVELRQQEARDDQGVYGNILALEILGILKCLDAVPES